MPIEQVSPELESIVSLNQEVEVLGTGYVGGEGPLWWKDGQYLLFSEVRGDRRRKWSAGEGVNLFNPLCGILSLLPVFVYPGLGPEDCHI